MACTLYMAWDERLTGYDFGPGHPLAPVRVELTIELARAFGLLDQAEVTVEQPVPATDAELELVHDPGYIEAVRLAGGSAPGGPRPGGPGPGGSVPGGPRPGGSAPGGPGPGGSAPGGPGPDASLLRFGLGTPDDPVFPGMHDASALVAGATLAAARAVWTGGAPHGANIPGGLHPAMRGNASGVCGLNDPPHAIPWPPQAPPERSAHL